MSDTSGSGIRLEFFADPSAFLAVAGDHLAEQPVISTVVATTAQGSVAHRTEGTPQPERDWWLAVRDESGAVVGAGMRTAPFAPVPVFLLPMPQAAAVGVARALHERGEEVLGVNGALPAARVCAGELVRLRGGRVEVDRHTRLHELGDLVVPASVPGGLVAATEGDLDLVMQWLHAFADDADHQAGRPPGAMAHEIPEQSAVHSRIRDEGLWFWVDGTGRRVHLSGLRPPSFGVARIGPVYTPPDQRGRGWASNAVAEISRRITASGARACLYTDQANPTSNKVYAALGYRPVVDMANLLIVG
jgi:hypothetical protein